MIDSRTAAHKALYTTLAADAGVTALADVWGHAEEDTQPTADKGIVQIGLAAAANLAAKDGGLDEVTIDILAEVRQPDPTAMYALSTAIRNAVEGQPMPDTDGAIISAPEFVTAQPVLEDDGETYFDAITFRLIVQPE